jgi:transposase
MLRLARDGVSAREIGRTLGVARSTIQDNLKRAAVAGLAWPLAGDLTDAVLEQRLFAHAGVKRGFHRRAEPDWGSLACELKRPGVNLMVLWEEHRAVDPAGYGYSRFCDLFREFERRLSPTMRQDHPVGDKVFVDYSGKKIMIVDRATGVVREAEIFVAVLGASNYTYAEATWTQKLADWIEAHVRMFRFFGGVPRLVVPDNLKSGVHRASFYDPEINSSYGIMASHYGVGILPARPQKPRDKAKVEAGVRFAQTYSRRGWCARAATGCLRYTVFWRCCIWVTPCPLPTDMRSHRARSAAMFDVNLNRKADLLVLPNGLPIPNQETGRWRKKTRVARQRRN